jgi:hypothetical protein
VQRRSFIKALFGLPFVVLGSRLNKPEPEARNILLLDTVIAGFQYYQGEKVWRKLKTGESLRLIREPENPYDEMAIEVYWRGDKLGYIPRVDNSVIAQLMDRGTHLRARISWLNENDDPWDRVGVKVEMSV